MSLFLAHKRRIEGDQQAAEAVAAPSAPTPATSGSIGKQQADGMLMDSVAEDLRRLGDTKSVERKITFKREQLVPKYREHVARLRESGEHHPLLGQYFVWLCDVGDMEGALDLGMYCDEQGIPMPERFNRDLRTFLADAVMDWAEREHDAGRSPQPYFSTVLDRVTSDAPDAWDVPDALRAKYLRLHGFLLEDQGKDAAALDALNKALDLGAQVKTRRDKLAKKMKAATETS